MRKYFPYLLKYRKALWLAPLLVIADVFCEIVQPALMSFIVDKGIHQKDLQYILHTGLLMVGLSIIAIASNIGNIYYSSTASVGFSAELRKGMFKKIQEFSFSNLDKFSAASLVTRLTNDVNILQQVIVMLLRLLIRAPLMLLFAVIIAIRINAGLAAVIGVAIPVLSISIYLLLMRGFPFFEAMQTRLDKVNEVIQENLVSVRVVKSFAREDFEKQKFGSANEGLREMAVKASGIVALIMPVMQLVMNVSIVAIVWFGGNKIIAGAFQVGQLMSFITYITQILMSLTMLSMTMMTFSRAGASSKRILEVLNTEPDITDSALAIEKNLTVKKGSVEFKDVCFKYHPDGGEYVLKNINLSINAGEFVAFIGATGSAKTTLVQLIPRLYDVSQGKVLVDGVDVRDYRVRNLRNAVGMVLQQNELFSGTISENLRWGNEHATGEEIIKAAKDAQAHDFIMSFPDQYETMLGQGGVNISGGQKQRLCIARALLKKPSILILDDSTSAVDIATDAKIRTALRKEYQGITTIVIAQRISSVQSADKIMLLDNGTLAGSGAHADLLKNSVMYQEIYHSQQLKDIVQK